MNTQKIKVLLAAIDYGSLSKAGQVCDYSQSAVTQMVRAVEDEIGFPLLFKSNKGVEPTREAELLIPTMRQMLDLEEKLEHESSQIRGVHRGTIRIGSYVSISISWIPQILEYFREYHPDVEFLIEECGREELIRRLCDGSFNMALMSDPCDPSVKFIPVTEDPLMVVFADKYDLDAYDCVPVEALRGYPFIMTYRHCDMDPYLIFERAGFMPEVRYYSRDDAAVLSMVERGLGLAILPELIIGRFPGDYHARMLDPEEYRTLGIGIKSMKDAGPLSRAVIKYIKENIDTVHSQK